MAVMVSVSMALWSCHWRGTVNPEDARALGLADGAYTDLVSEWKDGAERRAPGFRVVHYPTARGGRRGR
ncbi:hypothetical protein EAO76_06545 [Streptomyces sp. sk2.1]|nr:hypothetical protein EAO76_06545 [Streptomyces sp. sk2.1]